MRDVPDKIIALVKEHRVVFSEKARQQLDVGIFDSDDLIHSVIYGQLVKKEKDEYRVSDYKYTIIGPACSGTPLYSCGKIVNLLGDTYFIVTFHKAR